MSKIQNKKLGADAHRFAPAAPDEDAVYGACSPGWHSAASHADALADWTAFMERRDIQRVCSLVPGNRSDGAMPDRDESGTNLARYRAVFGAESVLHAPTPHGRLVGGSLLEDDILPFLDESVAADESVVVHSLSGIGRTGQVLAAWLAHDRGEPAERALEIVGEMGRRPYDVVRCGDATEDALHDLIGTFG